MKPIEIVTRDGDVTRTKARTKVSQLVALGYLIEIGPDRYLQDGAGIYRLQPRPSAGTLVVQRVPA